MISSHTIIHWYLLAQTVLHGKIYIIDISSGEMNKTEDI